VYGKKLLAITLLIMVALLSVAGCVTPNDRAFNSPSPTPTTVSPSPVPTVTSTQQPSNTLGVNATMSLLTKVIKDSGGTILEPFTSSTNSVGNTVLAVKYREKTGEITNEKVEICKDSNAVDARFQATINDAQARGYSGDIATGGRWNGVNTSGNKAIVIAKANDLLQVISVEMSSA
jgi:hypothetical protein